MSQSDHEHPGHGHSEDDPRQEHAHRGLRGVLTELFRPHSHDVADSVDPALEASVEGIRAVKISLVALLVTAVAQAAVVVITGSVALLADTIHNFSDALTAVPLWIAFALGSLRPNATYTYGYGRAEDLAGVFIVLMIAISAVVAGYESVRRLVDPAELTYPWVVVAAGLVGFAGNESGRCLPDPDRPTHRLGRVGGRRSSHPHRRGHFAGRCAWRRGRDGWFPPCRPARRAGHHGRHPARAAQRGMRHLRPPDGRRRPGAHHASDRGRQGH
ncbi:cation diffusion facilitator family transporter [Nocardioides sp. CF8]|nr:cation diffusion facilitator family transporter [Nocardioides sp. CF8]